MEPNELLKQAVEDLAGVRTDLFAQIEKQNEEIKQLKETKPETASAIEKFEGLIREIEEKLTEEAKSATDRMDSIEADAKRFAPSGGEEAKALGTQFTESTAYKTWSELGTGLSAAFQFKSFFPKVPGSQRKATLTTVATSPQDFRVPGFSGPPLPRLVMRDLMPVNPTTANAISFMRETSFDADGLAVLNYGPAAPVAEGAAKPEGDLRMTEVIQPLEVIAHNLPISRQALADTGQLEAYLNQRLVTGVAWQEERQILLGTGTTPQIQGLLTDAGRQIYDKATPGLGETTDTLLDAIRRATTLAHVEEYTPDGVAIHQTNFEELELLKGSNLHYIYLQVPSSGSGAPRQFFTMPLVVTNAMPVNTALVGAFSQGTALWDREEANVRMSDSHGTNFTSNIVVMLAEERVCQTIYRPDAFVEVQNIDQPST